MTASANIHYTTDNLVEYFGQTRISWADFYPSEQQVWERLAPPSMASVLDMGCACGGLGLALRERFGIIDYTGVEINPQCVAAARQLNADATFLEGDFLALAERLEREFDVVVSLSCADWNVETERLLTALFAKLKHGGHCIVSVRMTDKELPNGVADGEQAIVYGDTVPTEDSQWAPYKVYHRDTMMALLSGFPGSGHIYGYGYARGCPDTVRGIPLDEIVYGVFIITKDGPVPAASRCTLDFPEAFLAGFQS